MKARNARLGLMAGAFLVLASLTACGPSKAVPCPADGGPFVKGQDADYGKYSDRDGDGVACE